jgi:hypothetical protein
MKAIQEIGARNCRLVWRIRIIGVNDASRKNDMGKAMGLDEIPIEVWKCLGDVVCWLTNLFNKVLTKCLVNGKYSNTYFQEQMRYSKLYKIM